jgi:hypothetical protein
MNYAEYLRRQTKNQQKIIGFQNGQDASQVTYKAAARASGKVETVGAVTSYSQIGGSIANVAQTTQSTNSPSGVAVCSSGYSGVANGLANADRTGSVLGAAVHCAVCSDVPSSAPYAVVVPCVAPISTWESSSTDPNFPSGMNAPGVTKCCKKDYSQLFRDNAELTRQQGLQSDLRIKYGLPNKLQGLRGPVVLNR